MRAQRAALADECDRLWREVVCRRDRWRCRKCGKAGYEAAHIFTRGVWLTRWLDENGLCLCRDCHAWAHAEPAAFQAWVKELLGARRFGYLHRKFLRAGGRKIDLMQTKARLDRAHKALLWGG